jgi:hypothetical protein
MQTKTQKHTDFEDVTVGTKPKLAALWTILMFFAAMVEVALLMLIMRYAWRWPRTTQ